MLGLDPARDRRALSERSAFVPDRPDAWGFMTPPQLARFLAAHHPRWNDEAARRLLTDLRVPADRPLSRMSRGEATKAMFAVSLAHEPEVLLLDEPFGGLDPLVHDEVSEERRRGDGRRAAHDPRRRRTTSTSRRASATASRSSPTAESVKDLPIEAVVGDERVQARREALKGVLAAAAGGNDHAPIPCLALERSARAPSRALLAVFAGHPGPGLDRLLRLRQELEFEQSTSSLRWPSRSPSSQSGSISSPASCAAARTR